MKLLLYNLECEFHKLGEKALACIERGSAGNLPDLLMLHLETLSFQAREPWEDKCNFLLLWRSLQRTPSELHLRSGSNKSKISIQNVCIDLETDPS